MLNNLNCGGHGGGIEMRQLLAQARDRGEALLSAVGYASRPTFMIIGAQKCGTSWLDRQLDSHPQTFSAQRKEVHFFDQDSAYNRGEAWYLSHFPLPHQVRGKVGFEATPSYLYYPRVAERLHVFDSTLRLIVLLREPTARAHSAWNMYCKFIQDSAPAIRRKARREYDSVFSDWIADMAISGTTPTFAELVDQELELISAGASPLEPSVVRRGFYAEQLDRFYRWFNRDQILVLDYANATSEPRESLERVAGFLGLDSFDWPLANSARVNARAYDRSADAETRSRLDEIYRPHNEALAELLGVELSW